MATKHPSKKSMDLIKSSRHDLFSNKKRVGKSNNQLSPHKRWRQSFKARYGSGVKLVSVNYRWYDNEGTESVSGTIVPYKSFIKHKKMFTNTPDFINVEIITKKEGKILKQRTYIIDQGITLGYVLSLK